MRRIAVAFIVLAIFVLATFVGAAGAGSPVSAAPDDFRKGTVFPAEFIPPVVAPIIDPFRPPPEPWLPGNRGLEYDTTPGQRVVASGSGVIAFAGQVGGDLFVTIRHDPQLVTTVGFVDEVLVQRGDWVARGAQIAVAGETMHFTARRNGGYVDPESLFVGRRIDVRLVPVPD